MYTTTGINLVVLSNETNLFTSLRQTFVETIRSFTDIPSCFSYLNRENRRRIAYVLITNFDDLSTIKSFDALPSVESILVYSLRRNPSPNLPKKLAGIFLSIEHLLKVLPAILETIEKQLAGNSLLFHRDAGIADNSDFYFYPLLKYRRSSKKMFVDKCRSVFQSNHRIHPYINAFERDYQPSYAVNWLERKRNPFPFYLMVNHALRTHNNAILGPVQFFLDDLTDQMRIGGIDQTENLVYLGTSLKKALADRLRQCRRSDIVAFQCFLWTHLSRADEFERAIRLTTHDDSVRVLFKIRIDHARCFKIGTRYLIEMSTPFRIDYVTGNSTFSNRSSYLMTVKLMSVEESEIEQIYDSYYQQQTEPDLTKKLKDLEAIADKQMVRRQWSKAERTLKRIVDPSVRVLNKRGRLHREYLDDPATGLLLHQKAFAKAVNRERYETLTYIGRACLQLKEKESSLKFYERALNHYQDEEEKDLPMISRCFIGIANAQRLMKKFDEALKTAEKALRIREYELKPIDESEIAACLGTIGSILFDKGEVHKAIEVTNRSLQLLEKGNGNDPRLSAALSNLGAMHNAIGQREKAREYFEKALNSLPDENHFQGHSTMKNLEILNKN